MLKPIGIIAAPNGAYKQKTDHCALPVTIEELVLDTIACRDAGAAMVHVHARDENGQHSLDIELNARLLEALSRALGDSVIVQLTTEAVGRYSATQQMALIEATCPPAASFALRELLPNRVIDARTAGFFRWLEREGIISQFILYDSQDVVRYNELVQARVLPQFARHCLLVLGRHRKPQCAVPSDLIGLLDSQLVGRERWSVCAFGQQEQQCLTAAMLLGGDARVGFENNHLTEEGLAASSNAFQVKALADRARSLNLPIYSAAELSAELCAWQGTTQTLETVVD